MASLLDIPTLMTGRALESQQETTSTEAWSFASVEGRLVELRSVQSSAGLTLATRLLVEAQALGEPVAWITACDSTFFAPDMVRNGVDLRAVAFVRMRGAQNAARAADRLVASGAFGLLVIDFERDAYFPSPLQTRLMKHAEKYGTAVLCLTRDSRDSRPLGSMVSLRVEAQTRREGEDRFRCELRAEKDKRRGPHWSAEETVHGPPGLR